MHRVHDGTRQARALPRAKRFNLFQWGNKRKKMQKNKQTNEVHVKNASESVHSEKN